MGNTDSLGVRGEKAVPGCQIMQAVAAQLIPGIDKLAAARPPGPKLKGAVQFCTRSISCGLRGVKEEGTDLIERRQ